MRSDEQRAELAALNRQGRAYIIGYLTDYERIARDGLRDGRDFDLVRALVHYVIADIKGADTDEAWINERN